MITSLGVWHVRVHDEASYVFNSRVTVFAGRNGSGKTSLLEAIYLALRGGSFRGSDVQLLRSGEDWWRIDINHDGVLRKIKFDNTKQTGKKKFEIDESVNYRLPIAKRVPVVLFEPNDLRLLDGSPARRRDFIDGFIAQISPQYSSIVRKYERALKQRNTLLKNPHSTRDDVFVWDMALAEYGAEIVLQRTQVIERINTSLDDNYTSIAGRGDNVSLHYSHTLIDNVQQKMVNELHVSFERDHLLGFTSIGPHRHDVLFRFRDEPAVTIASRGEVRSIILALKFIEVDIVHELTGEPPVILLDDVFAELDEQRQQRLAEKCKDNQMFITSTGMFAEIADSQIILLD